MSGSSASRRGTRLLVALQVAVIVATLFSPLPAAAADDPPADPPPSAEPTPTPASTPASTPEATPEPTPEATPEPTPEPTPMPTPDPALATEPYIVTFVAGVAPDDKDTILASVGAVETGAIHQLRMRTILLDPSTDAAAVATLRDDSRVARVDADRLRVAEEAPSDPSYAAQWALPQIEWDTARGTFAASEDAVVAVLDTGVEPRTPTSTSRSSRGPDPRGSDLADDPNGHGTAMAGIVAAETDNGPGSPVSATPACRSCRSRCSLPMARAGQRRDRGPRLGRRPGRRRHPDGLHQCDVLLLAPGRHRLRLGQRRRDRRRRRQRRFVRRCLPSWRSRRHRGLEHDPD